MPEYGDPENRFSIEYPEGWLPLTHEGSPSVSLVCLATGGCLKLEAHQVDSADPEEFQTKRASRTPLDYDRRRWTQHAAPTVSRGLLPGVAPSRTARSRFESEDDAITSGFGHTLTWVYRRDQVQIRCVYRCRSDDAGLDNDDLDAIIQSLEIHSNEHLDPASFAGYYYSLLKHHRPQLAASPPERLALTISGGQTVLLEHLYRHYLQQPAQMEQLMETHIGLLDYYGDDVPDLANFDAIKPLLFPKILPATERGLSPNHVRLWPGLAIGAVIRGSVFNYGVTAERLKSWGVRSLNDIMDDLLDNLYNIPPVAPRGLRNSAGATRAISYVDHPFSASFILFDDFFQTTAHNLGATEFLVGLPDHGCVSCFLEGDPRFVVQHTATLRWDYHRSVEGLTDTIYLVTGPRPEDVKPYDILRGCPKKV